MSISRLFTPTARVRFRALVFLATLAGTIPTVAGEQVLTAKMHHLRSGSVREWTDFPEQAEGAELRLTFPSPANVAEQTLRLRHRDVKQTWKVRVNDREIGRLPADEDSMVTFWALPPGTLKDGDNTLLVSSEDRQSDDIMIGDARLDDRPRADVLGEAAVEAVVTDADNSAAFPCRITIVDKSGSLMTTGASSREGLAVRPGVIYSADGRAAFRLPAGRYTLYAGRGLEYSVVSSELDLRPGDTPALQLVLRREVRTEGYVACDTHCHTLTLSGHGDATLAERMVTLAGEGIELPIATDHNVHADYEMAAQAAGVRRYFTPVIGNELTTPRLGHFNIFPIVPGSSPVDPAARDWPELFRAIRACPDVAVIVLNHPRDIHGGYRPFGREHHLSLIGENLDGWSLDANAMEVVNSGALQSDPLQLHRDWFGLLNRGLRIAPMGASDSHDVSRHFVGQGRTYVRCNDSDPGTIDIKLACRNMAEGRVLVSLGLLCEITVDGRHGPGDLVSAINELDVSVRVLGPGWTKASHVALYANGIKIREADIGERPLESPELGIKWKGSWRLPKFKHDVHLVAIATGPGVKELFWPIPRPYQPTSPVWNSYVIGSSGAVWIDADGSGRFTPAVEYATRLVDESGSDFTKLIAQLGNFDAAVAAQTARVLHTRKLKMPADLLDATARTDVAAIRDGFQAYVEAWRECVVARAGK